MDFAFIAGWHVAATLWRYREYILITSDRQVVNGFIGSTSHKNTGLIPLLARP